MGEWGLVLLCRSVVCGRQTRAAAKAERERMGHRLGGWVGGWGGGEDSEEEGLPPIASLGWGGKGGTAGRKGVGRRGAGTGEKGGRRQSHAAHCENLNVKCEASRAVGFFGGGGEGGGLHAQGPTGHTRLHTQEEERHRVHREVHACLLQWTRRPCSERKARPLGAAPSQLWGGENEISNP